VRSSDSRHTDDASRPTFSDSATPKRAQHRTSRRRRRAKQGTYAEERLLPQLRDPEYARGPNGIGGGAYTHPANFTNESIEYYFAPLLS